MLAHRRRRSGIAFGVAGICVLAACALAASVAGGGAGRTVLAGLEPANVPLGEDDLQKGAAIAKNFPPRVVKQMDLSVDPCEDFYSYACGGFMEHTQIPEDLGGFARSWDGGSAKIYKEMAEVLKEDTGKAGDWRDASSAPLAAAAPRNRVPPHHGCRGLSCGGRRTGGARA